MSSNLATLRKCGKIADLHTTDAQCTAAQGCVEARAALGLTRSVLARRLGVVTDLIRRYETERTTVNRDVLERDEEFFRAFERAVAIIAASVRRAA